MTKAQHNNAPHHTPTPTCKEHDVSGVEAVPDAADQLSHHERHKGGLLARRGQALIHIPACVCIIVCVCVLCVFVVAVVSVTAGGMAVT